MDGISFNKDIDIDFNLLSATVTSLKADNLKIADIINKIYDSMKNINDEEVWKSPEQEEMMNELMPYLDDTKTSLYDDLNNCLEVLDAALNNYVEYNEALNKEANEIIKIVEE